MKSVCDECVMECVMDSVCCEYAESVSWRVCDGECVMEWVMESVSWRVCHGECV